MPENIDALTAAYIRQHGHDCARTVFSRGQIILLVLLVLTALLLVFCWPWLSFLLCLLGGSLLALGLVLVRVLVYLLGLRRCRNRAAQLPGDAELPVYTLLVPLYQEQAVIPHLIASLSQLDYPQDKLDIILLVEEADELTRSSLAEHHLPACMQVLVVPDGQPRTKPRACNVGLQAARGDFVVIYDAEDRPEADQLRKAVAEFQVRGDACACLQARLTHYNTDKSLPARWTDLDYLLWYSVSMNGLQRLGLPMPLGGTSNHFRIDVLRSLGGWDPFNVTEDCDLGLRLARSGKKIRMLDSATWEEAVTGIAPWMKQRSRWIKGFMQTALVHCRLRAMWQFGFYRFLGMLLFVPGSVLMQLAAPLLFIAPLMLLLQAPDSHNRFTGSLLAYMQQHSPGEMLHNDAFISAVLFVAGLLGVALGVLVVLIHLLLAWWRARSDLLTAACSIPLAWCCLALAAWRALAELIIKPFYWAKTIHGEIDVQRVLFWQHPWLQRLAVLGAVCSVSALIAVYLIRVDLIVYTWGQERQQDTQKPTSLQRAGIVERERLQLRAVADDEMATWWVQTPQGFQWSQVDGLSAMVRLPQDAPASRQLQWEVRLEDRYYFLDLDDEAIVPGRWTRLELDLRPWNNRLRSAGHQRVWDNYVRDDIQVIRLADYESAEHDVVPLECHAVFAMYVAKADAALAVTVQQQPTPLTPALELCEWQFDFNQAWDNPYDDECIAIDAILTHAESGRQLRQPAFFKVPFQRSRRDGREELFPDGAASWCLRWAAPTAGTWQVQLELRESGELIKRFDLDDISVSTGQHPGYVQRHPEKPYLQHANGDFFYPIGHNLCWPVDTRQPFAYDFKLPVDSGTYAYDRYFERMAAAGENWARIWMAYTWLGLEGIDQWRHFDGLGRYNQAHAERMDYLLAAARRHGIYIRLTLQHYSDFSTQWGNTNWRTNPYSSQYGGPLRYPGEFLFNETAKKLHKQKLRYLQARWGWDTYLESWELWGEVNLLRGFDQRRACDWHREMVTYIRSLDKSGRPVFTHCHNWQLGMRLWALDEVDCVQGNGYIRPPNHTTDHTVNFRNYLKEVAHFNKPVFMAEYGGRSELGAPSRDYLEAQLHSGLWAGAMQPFAGSAFSWWWNFIEGQDLYFHFTSLQRFLDGIDRIERDLKPIPPLMFKATRPLRCSGLQDDQGGIYWIYHKGIFESCDTRPVKDVTLDVYGPPGGVYRCRVMDTWTGEWLRDERITIEDKGARIALGDYQRGLALRLDRIQDPD